MRNLPENLHLAECKWKNTRARMIIRNSVEDRFFTSEVNAAGYIMFMSVFSYLQH